MSDTTSTLPTSDWVDLGGGRRVPAVIPWQSTLPTKHGIFRVEVEAVYNAEQGRYITRKFSVEPRDANGPEITGEVLRAIRLGEVLRDGLRELYHSYQGKPDPDDLERLAELGRGGPTDEALQAVAAVYEMGVIFGEGPTVRVARVLKLTDATAKRWVMRARDRGFLTVTDRRSPGSKSAR